ncbi:hypothetical protein [Nostoc sp. TCL240-02]|nr:hypothetical protein [Nostoc sp. TCL240-02]
MAQLDGKFIALNTFRCLGKHLPVFNHWVNSCTTTESHQYSTALYQL